MSAEPGGIEARVETWWAGLAVALLLLLPVDLLTTLAAVARHGPAVEANPLVRWLLDRGMIEVVVLANVAAGSAAVYLFHAVVGIVRRAPAGRRRVLVYGIDAWILLVVFAGIVLVANNLLAVV